LRLTGAEIIVKALEAEGVEVVFGYPGGAVLPLYDKLYDSPIKHILVRHEQGAAHWLAGAPCLAVEVGFGGIGRCPRC
jgi:acetolactate synthase-1/2/3 large subunit